MSSCKNDKRKKAAQGRLNVEIRHFKSEFEKEDFQERMEVDVDYCSSRVVENINANCETIGTKCLREDYFPPSRVYKISIGIPSNYDELQQLLATAIPKHYGPAVIERKDGRQILPGSSTFTDGETIVFREIRPYSPINDGNIQRLHEKFDEPNMYSTLRSLCASIR